MRKIDVDSDETREEFEWFRKLFQSSYGPFGKYIHATLHYSCNLISVTMVTNTLRLWWFYRCALFPSPAGGGGVVCLTSRAERLLQMIKTKNPALKMMVGGLEGHVSNCRDNGVYAALLAIK